MRPRILEVTLAKNVIFAHYPCGSIDKRFSLSCAHMLI